jgi:2-amino-4-hydroxy-6-hydroxymethyldihydropteridine diphosphokinase
VSVAYIALGSNLGDREQHLAAGLRALRETPGARVERVSSWYETRPVGGPPQAAAYLNGAAELTTTLSPEDLLATLLAIETANGRTRGAKDAPRTLDLDLLCYDNLVREAPDPILPHPRMHERLFVLEPLAEIAPGLVHPTLSEPILGLRARLLGLMPFRSSPGRELSQLRALVTGASSGIGRAIALELAAAGVNVIVHARTSRDVAEEVATRARRLSGAASEVFLADLSRKGQPARLAKWAWEHWQGLDILVNNAGVDTLTGEAASWSFDEKLAALLRVDVEATIALSREIGGKMKERGDGVILNIGWDQAETGMEGNSGELFAATKGAVMAFTRSLALSLAPQVRVHCIAPGWIRTAWGEKASTPWQERVLRETPLQRWGTPEDVAAVARFLCGPGARYLTGQTIRVNGGAVR